MLKGLEKGLKPDFIAVCSRPPAVYRGRPFIIEAGIAFGGDLPGDEAASVYRFANRVPLLYQQSACSSFKAVSETNWRNYAMQQPKGSLPVGPMVVMLHMASVWVPFTSESKEAIADYDEIREEMELALKDCGRKLKTYLNKRQKMKAAGERRSIFLRYIGEIAKSVAEVTGEDAKALYESLMKTAQRKTLEMDQVLDESGKVVEAAEKLEGDEAVYVKPELDETDLAIAAQAKDEEIAAKRAEKPAPLDSQKPAARKTGKQAASPASKPSSPADTNLFGEPAAPATTKKKILVKKKVKKK
jgi:DNA topoisomerase-6 subunit B